MPKIFVRERNKIQEGDRQPRFAVVGVEGTNMTFFQFHLRQGELDTIAQAVGAEVVMLPRGKEDHLGEPGAGGKARTRRAKRKTAK